ncbi:MAG: polysaccharide deacetylase family protein [Sandaracinaceae bacterium]|nr:polysaccharide deacetylase family protein [Sandaracinaceae bacterium]
MTANNLYFHYVCAGPTTRRMTIEVGELERIVERERATRRAVSLDAYVGGAPAEDTFTVSFDDAHASILEHAAPLLARLGVPATLFVPTAYVGTSRELLDWDGLRALRDLGWTLGSHSVSHPRMGWRLYDEDDAAYRARLLDECARSREVMARELGEAPALFAYPYGEAPDAARDAVGAAGYAAAFTVRGSTAWDGDPLRVPRVEGEPPEPSLADTPTSFSVVVPAFDRVYMLSEVVTRLASQHYPEDRYEVIVVDDGSRDDLSPIFEDMPDNVRCVRQGDAAFRAGQARQRGADEAKHDVLAFLDADVAVGHEHLWHLDWVHRHVPDAVLLGYLSGYNLHDLGHVHTLDEVRRADVDRLRVIPDRSREPTLRACLDHPEWLDDPWALTYTGNLSLPRALFERVGGFAKGFVGWGLEDIDLGYRLHRAGARFVFSRFAVGFHMTDPDEPAPRNPFRATAPTPETFTGYLENLARLEAEHAGDPVIAAFAARTRSDVEETCSRPHTVGIELGGAASVRSPFHARLHRLVPGGVPPHELYDRVAYAEKVRAKSVYLLGGAPAEHPAFLDVVRRANAVVEWVAMRSPVYPFAAEGLAEAAKDAGLVSVTCEVHAMAAAPHEAVFGPGTFEAFRRGLDRLAAAGVERSARVVLSPATADAFEATLEALAAEGVRVDEVVATSAELAERYAAASPAPIELLDP